MPRVPIRRDAIRVPVCRALAAPRVATVSERGAGGGGGGGGVCMTGILGVRGKHMVLVLNQSFILLLVHRLDAIDHGSLPAPKENQTFTIVQLGGCHRKYRIQPLNDLFRDRRFFL